MQVRGFAIEFIEVLSKIKEMLSCPELINVIISPKHSTILCRIVPMLLL